MSLNLKAYFVPSLLHDDFLMRLRYGCINQFDSTLNFSVEKILDICHKNPFVRSYPQKHNFHHHVVKVSWEVNSSS